MCSDLDDEHSGVFSLNSDGLSVEIWSLLRFVELVELINLWYCFLKISSRGSTEFVVLSFIVPE